MTNSSKTIVFFLLLGNTIYVYKLLLTGFNQNRAKKSDVLLLFPEYFVRNESAYRFYKLFSKPVSFCQDTSEPSDFRFETENFLCDVNEKKCARKNQPISSSFLCPFNKSNVVWRCLYSYRQRYSSSQWSKCCGLTRRSRVSPQQITTNNNKLQQITTITTNTLKKKGRAFRNIGKYTSLTVKSALLFF